MGGEQDTHSRRRYRRPVVRTSSDDIGSRVARVRPWPRPGRPATAQLVLTDHRHRPRLAQVERWVDELRDSGYELVRTGAVEPEAADPFLAGGFVVAQRLALLQLDAPFDAPRPDGRVRAMRMDADERMAAAIDLAAFGPEWCFDVAAIDEARRATPAHRARLALDRDGRPVGYAVAGRAGRNGFLQRLAVSPSAQREGHGAVLVADALRWLRRWRTQTVLVNTEVTNESALRLYQRAGFRLRRDELLVLERAL
jgi:ribosomal protein S18 acetylase RimI-like enzyme